MSGASPSTRNDRINNMSVKEKAVAADEKGLCVTLLFCGEHGVPEHGDSECNSTTCKECWKKVLNGRGGDPK